MTKALVTIEVDINTDWIRQLGLGENSNPQHITKTHHSQLKRDAIWDCVDSWVCDQKEFINVQKVTLIKELVK
jgi:hypothetical protein